MENMAASTSESQAISQDKQVMNIKQEYPEDNASDYRTSYNECGQVMDTNTTVFVVKSEYLSEVKREKNPDDAYAIDGLLEIKKEPGEALDQGWTDQTEFTPGFQHVKVECISEHNDLGTAYPSYASAAMVTKVEPKIPYSQYDAFSMSVGVAQYDSEKYNNMIVKKENQSGLVREYKCAVCDYTCKTKRTLDHHMRTKHDSNAEVFQCTDCNYSTKCKGSMGQHVRTMHNDMAEVYKCAFCDYTTKWKNHLVDHSMRRHNDDPEIFECKDCDYMSKVKGNLIRHIKAHHDETAELFQCPDCDYSNRSKCNYVQHVKTKHEYGEAYRCELCNYSTKLSRYLNRHIKVKHTDHVAEVFKCTDCEYTSKRKGDYVEHMRRKHGRDAKVYKCAECDYTARVKYDLVRHVRVKHDDEAEVYRCSECDYTTKWKSSIGRHARDRHKQYVQQVNVEASSAEAPGSSQSEIDLNDSSCLATDEDNSSFC